MQGQYRVSKGEVRSELALGDSWRNEKGYLWIIRLNFIQDCRIRKNARKELGMIVISFICRQVGAGEDQSIWRTKHVSKLKGLKRCYSATSSSFSQRNSIGCYKRLNILHPRYPPLFPISAVSSQISISKTLAVSAVPIHFPLHIVGVHARALGQFTPAQSH